jgi:hypothetical protein
MKAALRDDMPPELASLPLVLRLPEVATFMRRSPKSILNSLSAGIFVPLPMAERPYRWRRDDLAAWYRGEFKRAEADLREDARKRRRRQALRVVAPVQDGER